MKKRKKSKSTLSVATGIFAFFFLLSACEHRQQSTVALDLPPAATKAGVGLIHFNTDHSIALYRSPTDSLPFDSLQFVVEQRGSNRGQCKFVTKQLKDNLQPYIMDSGDSFENGEKHRQMGLIHFAPQITFRVSEKIKDGVFIIVNEQKNETCFVKLNPDNDYTIGKDKDAIFFDPNFPDTNIDNWYLFETWPQAITRAFLIEVPDATLAYSKPDGDLVKFQNIGSALFNADSVYKDWVHISNQMYVNEGEKAIDTWVKWIENDSIKVLITLNGGYE
ncbi:hypothetical protein [Sphingobacterium tabacisoli]|uniref:Lipoprotein n=1 Tax=Sphingobacterium tabacisoli TaxID=2044855 RepID=A0ABW5L4L2_9SPHI|nr:hypothetical protein [Sphingobacterium tabacisoli]